MRLRSISEVYSRNVSMLKRYLQHKPFDVRSFLYEIADWMETIDWEDRFEFGPEDVRAAAESPDDDEHAGIVSTLESELDESDIEDITDEVVRLNPHDAPTWKYVDGGGYHKPSDWLIHFSDDAASIKQKGFLYGVEDPDRLGLTKHMGMAAKQHGGYNFAFSANSNDANNAAHKGQYGTEAVMFRSGGLNLYHYGDEEDQIVFWGADVPTSNMVMLYKSSDGDWVVPGHNGRDLFVGDFQKAVSWIVTHERQYRRQLY